MLLLIELLHERKRAMALDSGKMNPIVSPDEHSKMAVSFFFFFYSVTLDVFLRPSRLAFHILK